MLNSKHDQYEKFCLFVCYIHLYNVKPITVMGFNPFSTETVLLVGYWSPITDTLLYT